MWSSSKSSVSREDGLRRDLEELTGQVSGLFSFFSGPSSRPPPSNTNPQEKPTNTNKSLNSNIIEDFHGVHEERGTGEEIAKEGGDGDAGHDEITQDTDEEKPLDTDAASLTSKPNSPPQSHQESGAGMEEGKEGRELQEDEIKEEGERNMATGTVGKEDPASSADDAGLHGHLREALVGARQDVATFKHQLAGELTWFAQSLLGRGSEDEEEDEDEDEEDPELKEDHKQDPLGESTLCEVGVTAEVREYVEQLCMHSETWTEFPTSMSRDSVQFHLTEAQHAHRGAVLSWVSGLEGLQQELLCQHGISQGFFWLVYFVLVTRKLGNHPAAADLCSDELIALREVLLSATAATESVIFESSEASANEVSTTAAKGDDASAIEATNIPETLANQDEIPAPVEVRSSDDGSAPDQACVISIDAKPADSQHEHPIRTVDDCASSSASIELPGVSNEVDTRVVGGTAVVEVTKTLSVEANPPIIITSSTECLDKAVNKDIAESSSAILRDQPTAVVSPDAPGSDTVMKRASGVESVQQSEDDWSDAAVNKMSDFETSATYSIVSGPGSDVDSEEDIDAWVEDMDDDSS